MLAFLSVIAVSACGSPDSDTGARATGSPSAVAATIRADAIPKAALSLEDMGSGWSTFDVEAVEGCTKIGGKICVENVPGRVSTKAEVAYNQARMPSRFVANTILLMAVEDDARTVVDEFRKAARTTRWSQSFSSGDATYELSALEFDRLADETLSYRIDSTVKDRRTGRSASQRVDYIVFRSGRVLSFLYAIGADSAAIAQKSAGKVQALVDGEL